MSAEKDVACISTRPPPPDSAEYMGREEDPAAALVRLRLTQEQRVWPLPAPHFRSPEGWRTEDDFAPRRAGARLLQQLRLTLDSVRRLTFSQQCSLVKNRVLKTHLRRFAAWRWLPANRFSAVVPFGDELIERLRVLLALDYEGHLARRRGPVPTTASYMRGLSARLPAYRRGDPDTVWANEGDEVEVACNYQRFYLFDLVPKRSSPSMFFDLMVDWVDAHPPSSERPWETFNCALRTINWLRIFGAVKNGKSPSRLAWDKIVRSIDHQARHIFATVGYHVPGNHVIVELFALWLIAATFPRLERSTAWKAYAERKLLAQLHHQITDSGWHCEQCTHYHIQVVLIAMLWLRAHEISGQAIDERLKRKLYKAYGVIEKLKLADDSLPMFGDSSFPFFHLSLSDDIAIIEKLARELFVGSAFRGTAVARSGIAERVGDYVIARLKTSELIVDVGTIGYHNNPGHGHADLFSFVYTSMGMPLFIDPGTRTYADDGESYELKSACMHNTISLADGDHALLWRYFRWYLLPAAPRCHFVEGRNSFSLRASCNPFRHFGPIVHDRSFYLTDKCLSITDSIQARKRLPISVNLIVAPGIDVDAGNWRSIRLSCPGHTWIVEQRGDVEWRTSVSDIFVYPTYNSPVPSKRITFACGPCGAWTESHITVERQQ